ncbi:MAG TPA: ATP-dependent helicase, partial [Desulfobacterales bacterium]|nr:ATP-dependent helicase [Desulfobacterales bacterium]
ARQATVFAIGDPDQAIYGFRGADLSCFLDFANRRIDNVPVRGLALTRNYRCAPTILAAATALIANNPRHGAEPPQAMRPDQAVIELHRAATAAAEAEGIVARIEGLTGGVSHFSLASGRGDRFEHRDAGDELGFSDIAVLCRQRLQAEPVIAALRRRGIPVQVVGDRPFWATPSLAPFYLRLLVLAGVASPAEQVRLCATLPGIGAATIRRLEDLLLDQPDTPVSELCRRLAGPAAARLAELFAELDRLADQWAGRPAEEVVGDLLSAHTIAGEAGRRLALLAAPYGTDLAGFAGFLQRNYEGMEHDPRMEGVAVMTVHAAKGLEFPAVFLAGLEDGLFPALDRPDCSLEEERRLFYVGLTRAERYLFLSSAKRRTVHGKGRDFAPSRFLAELPGELVTRARPEARPTKSGGGRKIQQLSLF